MAQTRDQIYSDVKPHVDSAVEHTGKARDALMFAVPEKRIEAEVEKVTGLVNNAYRMLKEAQEEIM